MRGVPRIIQINIFVKKLNGLNLLLPHAQTITPRGMAQSNVIKNIPSVYNDALSKDVVTCIKDGPIFCLLLQITLHLKRCKVIRFFYKICFLQLSSNVFKECDWCIYSITNYDLFLFCQFFPTSFICCRK